MYWAGPSAVSYRSTLGIYPQDTEYTHWIRSKAECLSHAKEGHWDSAGDLGSQTEMLASWGFTGKSIKPNLFGFVLLC